MLRPFLVTPRAFANYGWRARLQQCWARDAPHRFTDRLGVVAIILLALPIWRYKVRAHQLHRVTELSELASPVMRSRTRL